MAILPGQIIPSQPMLPAGKEGILHATERIESLSSSLQASLSELNTRLEPVLSHVEPPTQTGGGTISKVPESSLHAQMVVLGDRLSNIILELQHLIRRIEL